MNYVDQIAAAIQSQYPSLTEVIGIGRQNEDGVIVIGSETYGGISDKRDNYAYIRYRGREDWRHSRATRQISSTPTMEATAELRLVVVHREQDTAAFVEGLAGVLMGVFKNVGGVHIQVQSTDQDRNRILREESKTDNGQWNTAVGLARVDFTLTYTYTGQPCNPADLCGGGTLPTPTDCPTLCDQITVATAEQVVDCFDPVKEAAVKALICDPCPPIPTLCDQIEEATVIEIIECLSPTQEDEIKSALCDPCLPATYTNGAAFTQEIAAGETYTAPQVTMTAVDGTTEDIPANEDYTCEWKPITGEASDGNKVFELDEYPAGGVFIINDSSVIDAENTTIQLPLRANVKVVNAVIASAVNDTPTNNAHNLTIEVDVPVVNSNGDSVGPNVTSLLTPHELPQLPVTDSNGAVGSYPMPVALAVVGQVNSATYSAGTLTITPAGGGSSERIYQRSSFRGVPDTQYDLYDLRWQILNGTYNYGTPHGQRVALDFSAAHPFFTLVDNNAFGNKSRFTDSNGVAAPDGLAGFATIDWAVDRPTAIANYAIDHLTGLGWCLVKIGINETHGDALATAHAHTMGGLSGFRVPTTGEIEDVLNTAITTLFYGSGNIFYRSSVYVSGNETAFWANSTNITTSTQANAINNSGDIARANKTGAATTATYAVRTHYP